MAALLVTEKNNVHYRHATRAAREPGDRGLGALVFNLDCADLTEKDVQGHFKAGIKLISNTCDAHQQAPANTRSFLPVDYLP